MKRRSSPDTLKVAKMGALITRVPLKGSIRGTIRDPEGYHNMGAQIITYTFFFFWGGGFLIIITV